MNKSSKRFDRVFPAALLLIGVILLIFAGYRIIANDDALERREQYQLQQIQLEQNRVQIERAEFVRECMDDGGRAAADCVDFLNGTYSQSSLYVGC